MAATIVLFAFMAVLFWVLIVRPQRKRVQEHSQLLAALDVGDEIMSTAGIYGTVVAIHDDDTIELEVAEGVILTVAKGAIASRTADEAEDEAADGTDVPDDPSGLDT